MDDATLFQQNKEVERLKRTFAGLIVVQGPDMGKQFLIRRNDILIGRTPDCEIALMDKKVSRHHAMIKVEYLPVQKENCYRLIDLQSTNHVYLNGQMEAECVLNDGDKIQIGDTILRFSLHDQIDSQFHATIHKKIQFDALTGLLTIDSFKDSVNWEMNNLSLQIRPFAIVMMDIDDFKRVNDTFGHLIGSQVLKEIGPLISEHIRRHDIAARFGGEEFIAYMPQSTAMDAYYAADRLREIIASYLFTEEKQSISITISMGVSQYPENGSTLDELIEFADSMLYKAKKGGKNKVCTVEKE